MINHLDRGYYGSVPAYEDKTQAYFDPLNETKTYLKDETDLKNNFENNSQQYILTAKD